MLELLFASLSHDDIQTLIAVTGIVSVAIFAALAIVIPIIISNRSRLKRTEDAVHAIRANVVNDHPTNMREEQDKRAEDVWAMLNRIMDAIKDLRQHDTTADERILELERTVDRPRTALRRRKP